MPTRGNFLLVLPNINYLQQKIGIGLIPYYKNINEIAMTSKTVEEDN